MVDLISIKDFDPNLLKLDKKPFKTCYLLHWIHYKKNEYKINSVNPFYLIVSELDGFIEETEGRKYLNILQTAIVKY